MPQAISAGHKATLSVAKEVLLANGNAFDAAIAAHYAMFITEPFMASAGGNGFAIGRTENGDVHFLDFFCQTPINKNLNGRLDFKPVKVDFGSEVETFHIGLGAAAVPGSIAGLYALHRIHGTIPMNELVMPAIKLAKEGVPLSNFQAYDIGLLKPILEEEEHGRKLFFNDGKAKVGGEIIEMPGMADFLEFIGREGERGFYHGEIAAQISEDSLGRGGFLKREDFENYKVNTVDPLRIRYKNKQVYLANGPSKGGAMLALTLALCNQDITSMASAIKKTQEIIYNNDDIGERLDKYYPAHNFKLNPSVSSNRGTSHFNVLDKWGNAVSLTSSLGEGCGYFIPNTDMHLNNMMGEIFLLPDGAHSWAPNTRMHSMMTPTIVTDKENNLELLSGSGGANRIPYSIAQVMYNLYNKGHNLDQSTQQPRVHFQDGKFQVEKGYEFLLKSENAIFWDKFSLYFGGVHSIYKGPNGVEAVGDERRDGVAEVF